MPRPAPSIRGDLYHWCPLVLGDYNGDGTVDASDYTLWRKSIGSTTNLAADGNGNGVIDNGDFDVWRANFGQTAGTGSDLTPLLLCPSRHRSR